jgi:hypothetical protein
MVETGSNASSTAALMANAKGGNSTITAGLTSVVVAHGIAAGAPTGISVTPTNDSMGVDIWVDTIGATEFTVHTDFAQPLDIDFSWVAIR